MSVIATGSEEDKRHVAFVSRIRAEERERCAKIAETFHRWHGSADLTNRFDADGIAAAIRRLKD